MKILNIIQMKSVTDCCFLVKIVPDFQPFYPHRTHLYHVSEPVGYYSLFGLIRARISSSKEDKSITMVLTAILHCGDWQEHLVISLFPEILWGPNRTAPSSHEILLLTPMAFQFRVIVQSNTMLGQIRTEVL